MAKFVAYFRVSTSRQNLSFDAQKAAVSAYIGSSELIAQFIEIETGKNNDRKELKSAIVLARKNKATLIIAKLDRLSRNLSFIANLLDADVEVVCADMPNASKMVLQMMGVVAEFERKQISERTKAALQAAKERGTVLGNHTNWEDAQALGHEANIKNADLYAEKIIPIIRDVVRGGIYSVHKIADVLQSRGIATRRGGAWNGSSVLHIIKRSGFDGVKALAANT